mmetsp:Transcript_35702/g.102657  ORF Transcript_35702/g.102657 Transcript_35702/m.102657 type:complete len:228 (-) Transcript_35702:390-1073(-)
MTTFPKIVLTFGVTLRSMYEPCSTTVARCRCVDITLVSPNFMRQPVEPRSPAQQPPPLLLMEMLPIGLSSSCTTQSETTAFTLAFRGCPSSASSTVSSDFPSAVSSCWLPASSSSASAASAVLFPACCSSCWTERDTAVEVRVRLSRSMAREMFTWPVICSQAMSMCGSSIVRSMSTRSVTFSLGSPSLHSSLLRMSVGKTTLKRSLSLLEARVQLPSQTPQRPVRV